MIKILKHIEEFLNNLTKMNFLEKNFKSIIILEIFIFIVISFIFAYSYSRSIIPVTTILVVGEGRETVIPNIAEINIGLISEGTNLVSLQKENTEKFNRVINYLKSQGIDDKDIKTTNYLISPKYRYGEVSEIVGYTINQTISVKIRDTSKVGDILSGVVKNGANNVDGPNFTVDNEKIYLEKAKIKAIKDAREQAERIAKEANVKLGRIVSISFESYQQEFYPLSLGSSVGRGGDVPITQAGSQEIKVWVRINYEIN